MIAAESENAAPAAWGPDALRGVREARRLQQEGITAGREEYVRKNRYFYDRLKQTLRYIIEPGKRVLELRCETGHLLAATEPAYGVGVEISDAMVRVAQEKNPTLHFVRSELEELELNETFDYIIFSHIFDTVDILQTFEQIRKHSNPDTEVIVVNYNQVWEPVLELASKLGLRTRFVEPNWVSENDVRGFLKLAGLRPVRKYRQILFPKWIPLVSNLVNGFLARLGLTTRWSKPWVFIRAMKSWSPSCSNGFAGPKNPARGPTLRAWWAPGRIGFRIRLASCAPSSLTNTHASGSRQSWLALMCRGLKRWKSRLRRLISQPTSSSTTPCGRRFSP